MTNRLRFLVLVVGVVGAAVGIWLGVLLWNAAS